MSDLTERAERVLRDLANNDEHGWAHAINLITDLLDEVEKLTLTPAEEDALATMRRTSGPAVGSKVRVIAMRSAYTAYSGTISEVKPNGFVVTLYSGDNGKPIKQVSVFFTPNEIEVLP